MTGPVNKSNSSGPLLYVVIGLLLLGGGGAWYFLSQTPQTEVIDPVPPVNPDGPVQTGRPLVIKELPFLTTENRDVPVPNSDPTEASTAPSNRTSNPFVPVTTPAEVVVPSDTTTFNPQPIDIPTTPIQVDTPTQPVVIGNNTPLPNPVNSGANSGTSSGNGNITGVTTSPPIVLPNPGNTSSNPGNTGNTGNTAGNNSGANSGSNSGTSRPTRAPVLPAPSVVQPGTSSSNFTVPEQETTVISAPAPVLISSLVIPQPKAETPQTEQPVAPKESPLLKAADELQLAFSSVVIGPNSTAVFNSKNGFLMAAAGQKLAGTDILVKSISQQQVTLQLGEETIELTLDRR